MSNSEKETILSFNKSVYKIGEGLISNKFTLDDVGDYVPGLLHINSRIDLRMTNLSNTTAKWSGYTKQEIVTMGHEYLERHLEPNTWEITAKKFLDFAIANDSSKIHSDLVFYRMDKKQDYEPLFTNFRILPNRDSILSITTPLGHFGMTEKKLGRIIEQDRFFKKHFDKFATLTNREVEILTLLANGNTNNDVSNQLFISSNTVRTHRNRIYHKLEIKHFRDIIRYAQAFDLI